jgi:hypothetical protein
MFKTFVSLLSGHASYDDVEDDLRKLGVKRWRRKALDREEWASIIREGKAKLKWP